MEVQSLNCLETGIPSSLPTTKPLTPKGEKHLIKVSVPKGKYAVDADALRAARAKVPKGEYH